jgi:hypothetical protein
MSAETSTRLMAADYMTDLFDCSSPERSGDLSLDGWRTARGSVAILLVFFTLVPGLIRFA